MKNLRKIMIVALFGAMSFGVYSTYEYTTMTNAERLMLRNVEALTEEEAGGDGLCRAPYTVKCMTIYPNGVPVDLPGTFTAR